MFPQERAEREHNPNCFVVSVVRCHSTKFKAGHSRSQRSTNIQRTSQEPPMLVISPAEYIKSAVKGG
ncbi:hypothetical protein pipiens_010993 [Culex pipiens pipiens]|uniref:Uncharacterized protein n=1 Tax=Culex pipiens pipiens TaxID=38569 RepID=A0ABD1D8K8_CULPP